MYFSKKIISIFILLSLILSASSCSNQNAILDKEDYSEADFKILCTTFAQYDWAKNITKNINGIKTEYLLENGGEIHSFQPSAKDIVAVNECDLLICVGGTSDYTILEILNKSNKSDSSVFNMMSYIQDRLLSDDADDEDEAHHHHDHANDTIHNTSDYDEHIWLSLKNAEILCSALSEKLCNLLPEHSDKIKSNTSGYISEISDLDAQYAQKISECDKSQIVVADRFPLIYMANDYSLECFKAFNGCSSETDASFNKILELSAKVDEYDLKYVIALKNSNSDIAKSVINNTFAKNQEILYIDSLQSVTKADIDNGLTFINAMKDNLNVIAKALD